MKKLIAVVLTLTLLLSLAACGSAPKLKKHENEVKAERFYDSLREALSFTDKSTFERSLTANYEFNAESKTKGNSGKKKLTEKGSGGEERVLEYDEELGLLYLKENSSYYEENVSSKQEEARNSEKYFLQNNDEVRTFNVLTNTYTDTENYISGHDYVQGQVNYGITEAFKNLVDQMLETELLTEAVEEGEEYDYSILELDDDTEITYFIDDNVYTAVWVKKTESDTDDKNYYYIENEITVQIVVEDDKITVAVTATRTKDSDYTGGSSKTTEESSGSLVIKFTDVKLKKPDAEKYIDITPESSES